jgi:arsenate reductase
MTITLFGIPNCDTVKKARVWLGEQHHDFVFHDFKKQGLVRATVEEWLEHVKWDVLVNRKGTTWRGLPDARKAAIVDETSAADLMLEFPSIVKRPVLARAGQFHVGFSADQYAQIFHSPSAPAA